MRPGSLGGCRLDSCAIYLHGSRPAAKVSGAGRSTGIPRLVNSQDNFVRMLPTIAVRRRCSCGNRHGRYELPDAGRLVDERGVGDLCCYLLSVSS
ncbi:MAG: hypothetical protein MZV64_60200 [Ignavibacteriales bacterium]|nr:hypothetical protein [Ignavibacteriales bacterium]